jgi:hypothetical protein
LATDRRSIVWTDRGALHFNPGTGLTLNSFRSTAYSTAVLKIFRLRLTTLGAAGFPSS